MPFFEFHQNNSGGSFDHFPKKGIGYLVVVEADSPQAANERAEQIGLYFDGCDAGFDCDCCGDRWARQWDGETGTAAPESYGRPVSGGWGLPSYIHYADGRVESAEASHDAR